MIRNPSSLLRHGLLCWALQRARGCFPGIVTPVQVDAKSEGVHLLLGLELGLRNHTQRGGSAALDQLHQAFRGMADSFPSASPLSSATGCGIHRSAVRSRGP